MLESGGSSQGLPEFISTSASFGNPLSNYKQRKFDFGVIRTYRKVSSTMESQMRPGLGLGVATCQWHPGLIRVATEDPLVNFHNKGARCL